MFTQAMYEAWSSPGMQAIVVTLILAPWVIWQQLGQRMLTEGECSVQLTSLHQHV
jgi:hypothetical protein